MVAVLCITPGQEWSLALKKEADVKSAVPMLAAKTILFQFAMVAPILYALFPQSEKLNSERVMTMILNYTSHKSR
jgi:hypothetical protein